MTKRIHIGSREDFPVGELTRVGADGTLILVAHLDDGRFCAVLNECSHLILPLDGAMLQGTTLTCPWHHSAFDICTGENQDWVRKRKGIRLPRWSRRLLDLGQTPRPLTTVPVIVQDGELYVDI